jgi:60 kDa SS-A/Ro ribonucleoprotein
MANTYNKHFSTPKPQSEKAHPKQAENNAGGFAFVISQWDRLVRFLILGAEGGTYYVGERKLVLQNCDTLMQCLQIDGVKTVQTIVDVSVAGRAPKQGPTLFAFAVCAAKGDDATRKAAFEALPKVCRTGSHLQEFTGVLKSMRSFGAGVRKAYAAWYNGRKADQLAYQLVKYQQRGGMSHRDILRMARVQATSPQHDAALRWAVGASLEAREVKRKLVGKDVGDFTKSYPDVSEHLPSLIAAYEELKGVEDEAAVIKLIGEHKFTHEMVPTKFQGSPAVWEALLQHMPVGALVRNLGRMTANGLIKPLSSAVGLVTGALGDAARLQKARLHPLQVLVALNTYARGKGVKGKLSWSPVAQVIDALDGAFYSSFGLLEPTGKRHLLALDVSGSMGGPEIAKMPGITPRVGSAAMAMVAARTEPAFHCIGFTSHHSGGRGFYGGGRTLRDFWESRGGSQYGGFGGGKHGVTTLDISPRQRLDDVIGEVNGLPFGGTDCSLPMIYALDKGLEVDAFVVYTDNETWAGNIHPHVALEKYRKETGINAKLIVVGMIASEFSIANPDDPGMLDVVGFDTAAPAVMANFVKDSPSES